MEEAQPMGLLIDEQILLCCSRSAAQRFCQIQLKIPALDELKHDLRPRCSALMAAIATCAGSRS